MAASVVVGSAAEAAGWTVLCSQRFVYCSNCTHLSSLNRSTTLNNKPVLVTPTVFTFEQHKSRNSNLRQLGPISKAADSTQPAVSDKSVVSEDEFSLAKVSFGIIGLGVGITLLSYGFGAYFNILPGSEWSAIMLTYGFPLAIIGMAFKYAELKPVPCLTYSDAQKLREKCATSILKQVRNDVTRYRYGDEQHLDEALKRIFQYGQGGGIPRRSAPILQMIREEVTDDGKYCLVLVFEAKALQSSDFEQRQAKFASFFGPGITAEVVKGEKDLYEVQTPEDIMNAKRLIFPGVGAFAPAMDVLNRRGMAEALCRYIEQDRPFLGICLGLQLLFESSDENGPVKGLGLIPGVVGKFDSSKGFRVPHIGWNGLQVTKDSNILDDIGNRHVYFVHSYRAMPSDDNREWISSICNYGDNFIASVNRGNVHAVQFHPEKSGDVGLSVLRRFLYPKNEMTKKPVQGKASKLAKRVIACLDVRANDRGDLVVTKGDQYDVRELSEDKEVRNLGKPVDLAAQYYRDGADEVSFLNITGFREFPLGDLPMLQVLRYTSENVFVPLTVGGGIRDFTDVNGREAFMRDVMDKRRTLVDGYNHPGTIKLFCGMELCLL